MKPELNAMSRKELERLKANVEKALKKLDAKDKKAALIAAEKAAAAHGFTLAEITADKTLTQKRKAKTVAKPAAVAKYKNPADPKMTWSGKGRRPEWFKTAIANGAKPEELEI